MEDLATNPGLGVDITMALTMVFATGSATMGDNIAANMGTPGGGELSGAPKFKAMCLELPEEVAGTIEEIVITKNGHPTAKLVACGRSPEIPSTYTGASSKFAGTPLPRRM